MSELREREYRDLEGNLLDQINNVQKDLVDAMVMIINGTLYRNISDGDVIRLKKFIETVSMFKMSFEEGILKMDVPPEGMRFLHSNKVIITNFKDENLNELLDTLDRIKKSLETCATEVDAKQKILQEKCCFKLEEFERLKKAIIEYSKI